MNTKIFTEWLPALRDYEFAAGYYIEMYDDARKYPKGTLDENYYSEREIRYDIMRYSEGYTALL